MANLIIKPLSAEKKKGDFYFKMFQLLSLQVAALAYFVFWLMLKQAANSGFYAKRTLILQATVWKAVFVGFERCVCQ